MESGEVSPLNKCQTVDAKKLILYDFGIKIKTHGQYDVGGTYAGEEPDLWFFYYTSMYPSSMYLLNLFVCHRTPGIASVGVSSSNDLIHKNEIGTTSYSMLTSTLTWKTVRGVEEDENSFIKTFCFTEADVTNMKNNALIIPISIDVKPKRLVMDDVINKIKVQHHYSTFLMRNDQTDFELISPSQKKYKIHKIVLAAHSSVMRGKLKNCNKNSIHIDIPDDNLELIIQFLYTGTINNILKQDCHKLLEIADKFQIKSLFLLIEDAIKHSLTIDNAVDIAIVTEKYKLAELQNNVFQFIKRNPLVFTSEGWKKLNNINLAKNLSEYLSKDN